MTDPGELPALAAQVNDLRGQVASLSAALATYEARIGAETGPAMVRLLEVKKIRQQVDELTAQMAANGHTSRKKHDDGEPTAPYWAGLDDKQYAARLAELASWVNGFLRANYPGYVLAACWANHPEAIWELGNGYAEWQRIYGTGQPALEDALWWHERWLPGILARLTKSITCDESGCRRVAKST